MSSDHGHRRRPSTGRVAALIAANDLRIRLRDRTAIIMGVVTPLVLAGLIGLTFGGGISFSATIAVVDADGSALSKGVVEGLTRGVDRRSPIHLRTGMSESAARRALADGRLDAVLVIPEGFGAAVPSMVGGGHAPPLVVVTDAGKRIAGDVTRAIARGIAAHVDASVLAVAAALHAAPPDDAASIRRIVAAGQDVTVPAALEQVAVTGEYRPAAYFGASMGILFLFFTVGAGARSLISERKEGTLVRIRAAPVRDRAVLLGKSLGVLMLGVASMAVIWLVTSVAFRAPWGDPVAVLAVIVAVVLAIAGMATMITGLARTDAQVDGLSAIVAFTMALIGGNFTQAGTLPGIFGRLSLVTPNGWALRSFNQIGAARAGLGEVLPAVGVLVTMAVATALIGLRGVRTKVLR